MHVKHRAARNGATNARQAGNDPEALLPGGELAAIVEANGGRSVPFPDMSHGWASRGDLEVPDVARDVKEAFTLALAHFAAHL